MNRPPLRDVAERAQVSEPTVSRVLNGRTGVASATRERVIAALAEFGFTNVPAPRNIQRRVIGIVTGELTNPVFPTFAHHLRIQLARHDYLVVVAEADPQLASEQRCIEEFTQTGVDGMIFIGGRHAEVADDLGIYRRVIDRDIPVVFVNGRETGLAVPHIRCDEHVGAERAVDHLVALGHERIGLLLGSTRYVPTRRFISGYRAALARHGLAEPADAVVETVFTIEGGRAGATRLLRNGITGVIAGNDLMAMGAVSAAAGTGITVPGRLSVVGYDGTDVTGYSHPPLTTLRQPFEDMAMLIADAIRAGIDGSAHFADTYVFEPRLVARDSSGQADPTVDAHR